MPKSSLKITKKERKYLINQFEVGDEKKSFKDAIPIVKNYRQFIQKADVISLLNFLDDKL